MKRITFYRCRRREMRLISRENFSSHWTPLINDWSACDIDDALRIQTSWQIFQVHDTRGEKISAVILVYCVWNEWKKTAKHEDRLFDRRFANRIRRRRGKNPVDLTCFDSRKSCCFDRRAQYQRIVTSLVRTRKKRRCKRLVFANPSRKQIFRISFSLSGPKRNDISPFHSLLYFTVW